MDKRYIESMGNKYMKNAFLTEEPEVFTYEPKRIPIGRDNLQNIFWLEYEDAIRFIVVGMAGCLPKGTLVRTKKGFEKIENVNEVISKNFKTGHTENKEAMPIYSGKKKIVKIKTKYGEIQCSPEHKWIVKRDGKICEIATTELKTTDKLLRTKIRKCYRQARENNPIFVNIDEKELVKLYTCDKVSIPYLTKKFNCSDGAIVNRLRWNNIKIRGWKEQQQCDKERGITYKKGISNGKDNGSYINGKMIGQKKNRAEYLNIAKQNKEWMCEVCGRLDSGQNDLIVHHIDGNNKNNYIQNLMVLCQGCHVREHFKNGSMKGRPKWKK
jgi:HNH endonuclease